MTGRGKSDPEPGDTWFWVCLEGEYSEGDFSWQTDEIHDGDWMSWRNLDASFEIIPGKLRVGSDKGNGDDVTFLFIHRSLTEYAE